MNRRILLTAVIGSFALLALLMTIVAGQPSSDPTYPPSTDISLNRTMADSPISGAINTTYPMVFGPHICTRFGDPFSPLNSPYEPGYYTYQFRIKIPADYPHDVLRVELFDPDSMNTSANEAQVNFTDLATNYDPVTYSATGKPMTCSNTDQNDNCLISTGELDIAQAESDVTVNHINPFWFVRVDSNRGLGGGNGNGTCGEPSSYTPRFNTRTRYELFYYAPTAEGTRQRIDLASYTGQTGDGERDTGDHQTDLRWISPGGAQLYDQPVPVPADSGSFQIDLTTDVPNILVDPDSGARYLYLEITTLSGASENGFDVWAGPYYTDFASDANMRNLQILNDPGRHDPAGVEVVANGRLPQNEIFDGSIEQPLLDLGPEYAGETITVTLFDTDAGTQPPIVFYFDTIGFTPTDDGEDGVDEANTDWALSFGGTADPNPEGRCFSANSGPGNCNDQWIEPPYEITIPGDANCDFSNPTPGECTPFTGGRLMARYERSQSDSNTWEIRQPVTITHDAAAGCSAFPIGIHQGARSVTPPDQGANPYPNSSDFDYPQSPPAYNDFWQHIPDVPLANAQTGAVFKVVAGNFNWLLWNTGINASAQTLANSLTWPGDSTDYTDHSDGGQPASAWHNWVVRGYVEPGDPTDIEMHLDDWVAVHTGVVNEGSVGTPLENHIDLGRTLRLPVWDEVQTGGSSARLRMAGFAVFRLHGYHFGQEATWLLLEFIRWDDSCGQLATATPIPTATSAATHTPTNTPTNTPVSTATATFTPTPTATDTSTATATAPSPTKTPTASATPTRHPSVTPSTTPGPAPTKTPHFTPTPSVTSPATATASATSTRHPSVTPSTTPGPAPTKTPYFTPTPSVTAESTPPASPHPPIYLPFVSGNTGQGPLPTEKLQTGRLDSNDIHRWTTEISAGDALTVQVAATNGADIALAVSDAVNGNLLHQQNAAPAGEIEAVASLTLPHPGHYQIAVGSANGVTTDYAIMALGADDFPFIFRGLLAYGDETTTPLEAETDHFWFFAGQDGEQVVITAVPQTDEDLFLELYGPEGTLINDFVDDGYSGDPETLNRSLDENGIYAIRVGEFDYRAGSYLISLEQK